MLDLLQGIRLSARLSPGASRAVCAAVIIAAFAGLSVICIAQSSETPLAIFVPLLCLLGLASAGIISLAAAGSTPAMITCFAVLLFLTNGNFRVRPPGDMDLDWQGLLKFVVWTGSGVVGLSYLQHTGLFRRPGVALWFAYLCLALLSISGAPSPVFSLGYLLSVASLFVFTIALADRLSEPQILWTITLTLAVFLIISWIVVFTDPELGKFEDQTLNGHVERIIGIGGQAVNLSLVCAIYLGAIFLLAWNGYARVLTVLPLAALGVVTIAATDSRTGLIGLCAGVWAVVFSRSQRSVLVLGLVATIGIGGALSFPTHLEKLGTTYLSRSGDSEELMTLTGRTQIWNFTEEKILESPLFGWGYNSGKFIIGDHIGFADHLLVEDAHNFLLQNLMSVGFIGTLPLVGLFLKLIIDLMRSRANALSVLFLVMVIASGLTDASAVGASPTVLTLMFMLASIWPGSRYDRARRQTLPSPARQAMVQRRSG